MNQFGSVCLGITLQMKLISREAMSVTARNFNVILAVTPVQSCKKQDESDNPTITISYEVK